MAAKLRRREAIASVKNSAHMVALHAEEPLVHVGQGIALDGNDATVFYAHAHMAAGAAETAGRLVPADSIRRNRGAGRSGIRRQTGSRGGAEALGDDGGGGGHRRAFDEVAAVHGRKERALKDGAREDGEGDQAGVASGCGAVTST